MAALLTYSCGSSLLGLLACLSGVIAGVLGLAATGVKRLLGLSSVLNCGWLAGLVRAGTRPPLVAYLLAYLPLNLVAFASLRSNHKAQPLLLALSLLSLGGLPPLIGFYPKLLALLSLPLFLSVGLILGSLLALSFYLSLLYVVGVRLGNLT